MKDDLFHPVVPVFAHADVVPPLFSLMQVLHLHLYHSVLGPEDIATAYGFKLPHGISVPTDPGIALPPDKEWRDSLLQTCRDRKAHRRQRPPNSR